MCSQLHTATEIMQIQEEKDEATSHLKKKLRRASQQQLKMSDFTIDHASKDLDLDETCGSVEIYLHSVEEAYSTWRQKMDEADKADKRT